jgi:ADP-ribose pyrophosphatase YjhB (NUDIX family)
MKYCSSCGSPVDRRIPSGDDRERYVCDACGTIHYQNPRVVTGCLPVFEDRVLLCKRAIEPRHGYWTLPAGFLENGETTMEGAIRETWEEAYANVELTGLYTVFNLPHISQVYMFFRAELRDLNYRAGAESLDVQLFTEQEIPWDELAFPVVRDTLKHYFADRDRDQYEVRVEDIIFKRR